MAQYSIDNISYSLVKECDFSWISQYGEVFCVFDQNDSGNISFGVDNGQGKVFIKFAGAKTINSGTSVEKAIQHLKESVSVYQDLKHPYLLEYLDSYAINGGFATVFKWFGGESLQGCFRDYSQTDSDKLFDQGRMFWTLPVHKKLDLYLKILEFHVFTAKRGYIAIDFYDGSIIYDYDTDEMKICDIDYYSRMPYINKMGRMWGSSRFISPEETEQGARIDEITNVFTMGAVAFGMFGGVLDRSYEKWRLNRKTYQVALKAVDPARKDRYSSLSEYMKDWKEAL